MLLRFSVFNKEQTVRSVTYFNELQNITYWIRVCKIKGTHLSCFFYLHKRLQNITSNYVWNVMCCLYFHVICKLRLCILYTKCIKLISLHNVTFLAKNSTWPFKDSKGKKLHTMLYLSGKTTTLKNAIEYHIFTVVRFDVMRLYLQTAATHGRFVHPPTIWLWRQGRIRLTGENRRTRKKTVPVPHCPQQISYGITRKRTQTSAVTGRRLTAWAMAWSSSQLILPT
jgi:hypothetical protein